MVTEWVPRVKLPTMRQGRKPKESEDEASGWEDFQQMEASHLGRVWWLGVIVWVPGGHVPHHDHVQLEGQSFRPAFSRWSSPISHVSVKKLSFCEEDVSVPSHDVNLACFVCSTPAGTFFPCHCWVNQHTVVAACPNFFLEGLRKEGGIIKALFWEATYHAPMSSDSCGTQWCATEER